MSDQPIKLDKLDDPQVVELECYSKNRAVEGQSRCRAFYIHVSIFFLLLPPPSPNLILKVHDQRHCFSTLAHTQAGVKKEKYSKKAPVDLSNRSHHIISLHYPLVLQNMLPFPIEVTENSSSTEKRSLKPGELTRYSHMTIINNPRFLTTVSLIITLHFGLLKHIHKDGQIAAPFTFQYNFPSSFHSLSNSYYLCCIPSMILTALVWRTKVEW